MRIFSEAQKHKLKIAARLLRKDGGCFENGNFYEAVINAIIKLDNAKQKSLKGTIDWLMNYERAEAIYWDTAPLPRMRKNKPGFSRKTNGSGSRR
jgi:hypothetical protein